MRVKLKPIKELNRLGYMVQNEMSAPETMGRLVTIMKPDEDICLSLDLTRCDDLEIVSKNTLTEEAYSHFKNCFEVLNAN